MRRPIIHAVLISTVLMMLACSQGEFVSSPVAKRTTPGPAGAGESTADAVVKNSSDVTPSPDVTGQPAVGPTDAALPGDGDAIAKATPTPTVVATLPGDGGGIPTPTATATPAPTPSPTLPAVDGALPKTVTVSQMVMWADEGSKIALDLTTGLWGDLNVFNFHEDGTRCQDFMGFVGTLQITTVDGSILSQKVDTTWRHWQGGRCSTGTQAPVFNSTRQMPGHWGASVKLVSATVTLTNSDGGNHVTVTQEGNLLVFTGYHSSVFNVTIALGTK